MDPLVPIFATVTSGDALCDRVITPPHLDPQCPRHRACIRQCYRRELAEIEPPLSPLSIATA
jgi:hypothetical protein